MLRKNLFIPQLVPPIHGLRLIFLHDRQNRRQLERAWRKNHSDNDRLLYRNQCRPYSSLLKKAQLNYFSSLFVRCSDTKSLWHSIDKVLHRGST